jgi:hypothetical protein
LLVKNRLGGGYGNGTGTKWEVTTQFMIDRWEMTRTSLYDYDGLCIYLIYDQVCVCSLQETEAVW